MITLRHPDTFGSAIAIAGYYRPLFPSNYSHAHDPALLNLYDLPKMLRNTQPPVALWVSTSARDVLSYKATLDLLHAVRPPTSVTAIIQKKVGHRVSAWVPLVGDAFIWLGQNLPGFSPI